MTLQRFIFGLAVIFAVFTLGFFVGFSTRPPEKVSAPADSSVPADFSSNVPVPRALFGNPVISQWLASVRGKLVSKTDDAIVLERDGKRLVINIEPGAIQFTDLRKAGSPEAQLLSLEDIPLGTEMLGNAFVVGEDKLQGAFFQAFYEEPSPPQIP